MLRLINAKRSTYHYDAISEFSDIHHLISTGVAKGFSINKYSWISDFLYKHAENISINRHIGYISFYSERNIFQQEYGNIERLHEQYPFLSEYNYSAFPKHYTELSTRQYFKVGQKFSEYDIIEYVNFSELYPLIHSTNPQQDPDYLRTRVNFNIRHNQYRSPVYYAIGYKLDMAKYPEGEEYEYYDQYLWVNHKKISPYNGVYKEYYLNEDDFDITLLPIFTDYYGDSDISSIIDPYTGKNDIIRMFDYKVNADNPEFYHFPTSVHNWVIHQRKIQSGSNKYYPYIGFVQCFVNQTADWQYITPYYEYATGPQHPPAKGYIQFYPEITQNGVLEPAKVLVNWGSSSSTGSRLTRFGSATFHSGVHLGEADDQSRIVYNICKHMTKWDASIERFILLKKDPNLDDVLVGLDLDTERNRRNSAVVMTEPYFTVKPIANGQVAKISFVNYKGEPRQHTSISDFLDDPAMYLKIKAPLTLIKELDRYLALEEVNTDIIDTLIIKNPRDNYGLFNSAPSVFYDNFGEDNESLLHRQDFCLDDLVGGKIGTGKHRKFYINSFGPRAEKYSDNEMKVSGMGFICRTIINQAGNIQSSHNEYLHVYCNNHTFTNTPPPGDSDPINAIPNEDIEILTDTSIVTRIQQYEKFRPMIKLPAVNGYIKILERNPHFKVKRSRDGEYEVIYNIEFPFCPGSVYERFVMNYNTDHPYLPTQILYKADYINAGSWEATSVGEDERYDSTNERYAPYGDDSFSHHELFEQIYTSDEIYNIGDGYVHYYYDRTFILEGIYKPQYHNEIIQYPGHLVWQPLEWNLLSLIKSQIDEFKKYGTYEINITQPRVEIEPDLYLPYFSSDLKLITLVDNRQWKFDKNKYSSFIGRENPAYLCEIDVSTLFEDFQTYQYKNGAIPDVKRWLYGYFSGFAHMMAIESQQQTKGETTVPGSEFLTTQDAKSNLVIEIWDMKSDIGNNNSGNWRPLSVISSDTNKIAGELILDNMFAIDDDGTPGAVITNEFSDIWSFYISTFDPNFFPWFPPEWQNSPSLDGQSNFVLSDSYILKNYHIIYIQWAPVGGIEAYKIFMRYDGVLGDLFVKDKTLIDVTNLPGDFGYLSIHKPEKYLSKNSNFSFNTNIPSPIDLTKSVKRYIDIRSQEGTNNISDFERYIDSNNKIKFRIRVRRNNDYPVNYINEDSSDIQYLGSAIDGGNEWVNFPWGDGTTFDSAFNWAKITITERLRKLGLTYFKCASR